MIEKKFDAFKPRKTWILLHFPGSRRLENVQFRYGCQAFHKQLHHLESYKAFAEFDILCFICSSLAFRDLWTEIWNAELIVLLHCFVHPTEAYWVAHSKLKSLIIKKESFWLKGIQSSRGLDGAFSSIASGLSTKTFVPLLKVFCGLLGGSKVKSVPCVYWHKEVLAL